MLLTYNIFMYFHNTVSLQRIIFFVLCIYLLVSMYSLSYIRAEAHSCVQWQEHFRSIITGSA